MNPVLDTATVVTPDDAAWIATGRFDIDPAIGEELKLEFSSPEQLAALLDLMKASEIGVDSLAVHDSADNWNYSGFKRLVYLRNNGPKVYSLKGNVTTPDGTATYLDVNVGYFVNVRRLRHMSNPGNVEAGDTPTVYFVNPNFPMLIWGKP